MALLPADPDPMSSPPPRDSRRSSRILLVVVTLVALEGCGSPRTTPSRIRSGLADLSAGNAPRAALAFKGVLRDFPDHPEALLNLALAHAVSGSSSKALALLDRAPDDADAVGATTWTLRGYARLRDGRVSEAIGHLKQALVLAPGDPTATLVLALAYTLDLDLEAAAQKLASLEPAHRKRPLAGLLGGYIAMRRGRLEASLTSFDQAQETADLPVVDYYRGQALYALGRPEEAVAVFDRYLLAVPSSPMGLFHRAIARFAAGDRAGTRRDLETLFQMTDDLDHPHLEALKTHGASLWTRLGTPGP